MVAHRFDPRRYSPRVLVAVGTVTLAFLALSFVVEIRVVIETPRVGNVTRLIQTFWRVFLGIATIGSFLLAIYNRTTDEHSPRGTARGFEIRGRNHDIDFHVHVPDRSNRGERDGERTATDTDGSAEADDAAGHLEYGDDRDDETP